MGTFFARDHPRACGEKVILPFGQEDRKGSPPRVRGKADIVHRVHADLGITPARAGKSALLRSSLREFGDHPRACGEKVAFSTTQIQTMGSPPRVRGKVGHLPIGTTPSRITPARAGKSPATSGGRSARRDHPRACGEKFNSFSVLYSN